MFNMLKLQTVMRKYKTARDIESPNSWHYYPEKTKFMFSVDCEESSQKVFEQLQAELRLSPLSV